MATRLKAGSSITIKGQSFTVTSRKGGKVYYKSSNGKTRGSTRR